MRLRWLLDSIVLLAVLGPTTASAWCPDPKPSVGEEAAGSDYVLTAIVVGQREVPEKGKSYDGWSYRLRPTRVFRGRALSGSEVFTENSSGRFPLEVGKEYLLFATRNTEGRLEFTNCGHSGLAVERRSAIGALEKRRGK